MNSSTPENDDRALVAQAQQGDAAAFETLVRRYYQRLYRILAVQLGNEEDARDVVQETFLRAFRHLGTFRGDCSFYSWLYRIAQNAAVDSVRRRRRRRRTRSLEDLRETAGIETSDGNPTAQPSHGLDTEERQRMVREAIAQLPEEFRTVLVLRELDGLNYEQIAEAIGHPVGTVRSRLHRARAQLKELLQRMLSSS
ncbi:MAG: sigma-70 family RNA polymerase sigma factor [Planctomycetota bacterium]|nr:MAG: sigma-70 family RNA polymerase sigma factor [Planctomycetota bacterium]